MTFSERLQEAQNERTSRNIRRQFICAWLGFSFATIVYAVSGARLPDFLFLLFAAAFYLIIFYRSYEVVPA